MTTLKPNNEDIIGIDVSKDKLDIYFLQTQTYDSWQNNSSALKKAVIYLNKLKFSGVIVLEATGGYEKLCHRYLSKAGFSVHIAHPKRVHHFIKQKGYFSKTDKIDAKAIAEYGLQESVEATELKDKAAQERQDLSARRAQIVESLTAEKCRYKEHLSVSAKRSLKRMIKHLDNELSYVEKILADNIEQDEVLRDNAKRLLTFKGVGKTTATVLLCALPELGQLTRQEIACLSGLAPRNRDSGRMKGKRMVTGGRPQVRKILYMASLSAARYNPEMKLFYNRLKEKGKPSKVCLTAVMRKIIITLNAMLRDQKEWRLSESLLAI